MRIRIFILISVLNLLCIQLSGQSQGVEIKESKVLQTLDGVKYRVHLVEKGQTVFSISKFYGIPSEEFHLKSEIDKIKIGDTIWIPLKKEKPSLVFVNAFM